jgi:hypothetical protein
LRNHPDYDQSCAREYCAPEVAEWTDIQSHPWNPSVPARITPAEFETVVLDWLRRAAAAEKLTIDAQRSGVIEGQGGKYKIDVLVTFRALLDAKFIVLVECKHQSRPVVPQHRD